MVIDAALLSSPRVAWLHHMHGLAQANRHSLEQLCKALPDAFSWAVAMQTLTICMASLLVSLLKTSSQPCRISPKLCSLAQDQISSPKL